MKLIEPNIQFKTQYLAMLADWHQSKEHLVPFVLRFDTTDFEAFVQEINSYKTKKDPGFVHHSTFWLLTDDDTIVGVVNIRHYLTEKLLIVGGHIGFGIRPSYRRQGYATKILALSLVEAKKIGIEKVLVTCDKDNIASAKVILKNGGVLWKEHLLKGIMKQNYWIDLNV